MRRLLVPLAMLLVFAALPTAAQAVTVQMFPLGPDTRPENIVAGGDGALWMVTDSATVVRLGTNGQFLAPRVTEGRGRDIAVGPSGTVYVLSRTPTLNASIVMRASDSRISTVPGISALGLAVGEADRVTIGGSPSALPYEARVCLVRFDAESPCTSGAAYSAPQISSLAYRADGLLAATTPLNDGLVLFSADVPGQAPSFDTAAFGSLPRLSLANDAALGPDGQLWFTLSNTNSILSNGRTFPLPENPRRIPLDIAVGPDGALWFTQNGTNAIGRITTAGQYSEVPLPAGTGSPSGITTGPDGSIWFTSTSPNAVGRISFDPVTAGARSGGGGGGGGAGGIADRAAPRVSPGLRLAGFRQGRGSTFTYTLSEPARVAIKVERRLGTGRRVDGRCVARTRRNRSRPVCTRYSSVGTVRTDGRQGANELRFSGRLNGRALSPGTYRASLTATDAAGNASSVSRATFTVRRR